MSLKNKIINALRQPSPLEHLTEDDVLQALREAYPDEDRYAGRNEDLVARLRAKALQKAQEMNDGNMGTDK